MHANVVVLPLACVTSFLMDVALPSILSSVRGQLVLTLILLHHMVYLDQILHNYTFLHCPASGMQKSDEALPSSRSAGRSQLVKILITLESRVIS